MWENCLTETVPQSVLSVIDYFALKHCCQRKVRIYEVPPRPMGISPCDKMVWNTSVETSIRSKWMTRIWVMSLPFHSTLRLPELTGKPSPVWYYELQFVCVNDLYVQIFFQSAPYPSSMKASQSKFHLLKDVNCQIGLLCQCLSPGRRLSQFW